MDWTLPAGGEFRFEVDLGSAVSVRLLPEPNDPSKGRAECMGMELAPGVDYTVSGPAKCAIFSYDGCRLLVTPENLENKNKSNSTIKGCSVEYVSCENEGAMHAYLNTHRALETLRDELESPLKVLILGTGRNTVARILTNYAIRMGRTILLTDVDPSSGSVLIPGTIAAHQITRPLSLIDGWWGASAGDGQPIAYFYGSTTGILQEESSSGSTGSSTKARKNHYKKICSRLAHAIDSRLTNEFSSKTSDKNNKHGGIIIVGPADADESTGEDLRSIFNPQLTLVVGNERLHATLEKVFFKKQIENDQKKTFTVLKLPRPSGVVTKDAPYRRAQIQAQFARFFYGPSHEYSPMNVNISFDDVSIRRLSDSSSLAPKSALPLGAQRKLEDSSTLSGASSQIVAPSPANLMYSIVAVPWAEKEDEDVMTCNIAGFLHITGVDESKRLITALSACPAGTQPGSKTLPSPYLLQGILRWIDQQ